MDEWHDFFLAQAGDAGGPPVWCSSRFPSTCRRSSPSRDPACRAAEALIRLVSVLTASILPLVPGQGTGTVGVEVFVMGLATWGCVVVIQRLRAGRP